MAPDTNAQTADMSSATPMQAPAMPASPVYTGQTNQPTTPQPQSRPHQSPQSMQVPQAPQPPGAQQMQPTQPMSQPGVGPGVAPAPRVPANDDVVDNQDEVWIERTKKAIAETVSDPYRQVQLLQRLNKMYLKERYNRDVAEKG